MFVGKLGRERRRRQRPGWFLDSGGTGSERHGGSSEQREVTCRCQGLQAQGRFPRAECQGWTSGFGDIEVGGKSPWVLNAVSKGLEGRGGRESEKESEAPEVEAE